MAVTHSILDQTFPRFCGYSQLVTSFDRDHIWTLSWSRWIWLSSLPCEYRRGFPWRKSRECKFDYSPSSCEQAKNEWSSASNPPTRLNGENCDTLNFILIKVFTLCFSERSLNVSFFLCISPLWLLPWYYMAYVCNNLLLSLMFFRSHLSLPDHSKIGNNKKHYACFPFSSWSLQVVWDLKFRTRKFLTNTQMCNFRQHELRLTIRC